MTGPKSVIPEGTNFFRWTCANCGWSPVLPDSSDGTLYCLICGPAHPMTKVPATRADYESQLIGHPEIPEQ